MNRLKHVDILKGIGILSVIFFHIFTLHKPSLYYSATFKIPIFFFLSGYLFKMCDFKIFIQRKFKGLIVPYFIFGAINLGLCFYFHKISNLGQYLERFFWINNHTTLFIAGALWFLTALFFVNLFAWLIYKYKKYYISIILFAIILVLFAVFKFKLPFSMDSAIFMVPVFYLGYLFRKIEPELKTWQNIFLFVILFVISLSALPINGYVNPRICLFNNLFYYYFYAIIGVLAYYYLSKFITKSKIGDFLAHFGTNSLTYMCLSEITTYTLKNLFNIKNKPILFSVTLFLIYIYLYIDRERGRKKINKY